MNVYVLVLCRNIFFNVHRIYTINIMFWRSLVVHNCSLFTENNYSTSR